jgi:tripartite-type tricarboxylate transporter receptor subunit TctC
MRKMESLAAWVRRTASAVFVIACCITTAAAQDFPSRPIRIIVGPSPDVFARIIAEHLQKVWGQAVVVEPRPGGGGKISVSAVTSAKPDGYTLLFATPTFTLATAMKTATWDFVNDFEPAALIGLISYSLVVNPNVPAKSVADLVALAKAKPGDINCASAGNGTVPHLACEALAKAAGIKLVHVPYRDVNSAMVGVIGGQVQMFVAVSTVARQQIKAGTVRGLAVTTAQRSTLSPELPTLAEQGYPSLVMPGWGGLMAPKGTPQPILDKIAAEVRRAAQDPEVQKKLLAVGMEPVTTPVNFGQFIKDDIARWTQLVNDVGLEKLQSGQ